MQSITYRNEQLEEHFATCPVCAQKAQQYTEFLWLLKSDSDWGVSYQEHAMDLFTYAAAAPVHNKANFSRAKSFTGKYQLSLLPLSGANKAILEVQVLDTITGDLIIENESGIIFKNPIINGFACGEVADSIDLEQILIYVDKPEEA